MQRQESERGQRRRLILENLANGVDAEAVAKAFDLTMLQLSAEIAYGALKLQSWCLTHAGEVYDFKDVGVLRKHRDRVHYLLERVNLDVVPKFSKITVETLDRKNFSEITERR